MLFVGFVFVVIFFFYFVEFLDYMELFDSVFEVGVVVKCLLEMLDSFVVFVSGI